jgi:hypothetical protein
MAEKMCLKKLPEAAIFSDGICEKRLVFELNQTVVALCQNVSREDEKRLKIAVLTSV